MEPPPPPPPPEDGAQRLGKKCDERYSGTVGFSFNIRSVTASS